MQEHNVLKVWVLYHLLPLLLKGRVISVLLNTSYSEKAISLRIKSGKNIAVGELGKNFQ